MAIGGEGDYGKLDDEVVTANAVVPEPSAAVLLLAG
jgi:hypothetical protein